MSHGIPTRITYTGGLPADGANVLFNSIVAFPPGGSMHLLGQKWFQFTLFGSVGTTNTVTAEYSNAGRSTAAADWKLFYSAGPYDFGTDGTVRGEIYIADLADVRVLFNSNGAQTTFIANLALLPEKATSMLTVPGTAFGGATAAVADT